MKIDLEKIAESSRRIWEATQLVELILAHVRAAGGNKNDCITVLLQLGAVEKADAKRIVHFSETWRDHLEPDTATQHDLDKLSRPDSDT